MPDFAIFTGNTKKILKKFKNSNILLIYVILVAIFMGIILASAVLFYFHEQNSTVIQSGVFIKGINVSGLTKEEAILLVTKELQDQMNDHIVLTYKNNEYYLEVEQIEAKFDIESSVTFALSVAKSGNFFQDMQEYVSILMRKINIEPVLTYNEEALDKYLKNIEANLPDQLEQSSYYIEDDTLVITNGVNGAGIYMDELKETIIHAIQDISYTKRYICIPTYIQYPDAIDVDAIHDEIYRHAENAYFTTEPYAVYAEVIGIDFDTEKMKEKIDRQKDAEEYTIDLDYTVPEVTVDDIGMEAFPDRLATFSTNYAITNRDRTINLTLASHKINGTVVMPGETFSYNKVVGKRTIAAGYKEAAIYENGQVSSGLGGGICQISTTLYNAVVAADMEIVSRRNHMFVPSYITAGKDATVVWGSTDFKFKNTRDYPIKITSSVENGVASVSVYGLKKGTEYNISIETKTIKKTSKDMVVDAYKVYRLNGDIKRSEKLSRDTYLTHSE